MLAFELPISKVKANRLSHRPSELTSRPGVLKAMAARRVDEGKALMIVDQLRPLSAAADLLACDRIARALPEDHRTLDQRRVDVAVDSLQGKEPALLGGVGLSPLRS
ncbi:hypothetical protein [Allokutzneria albata]|uniref:Uncharacterized protein n=1 Tax=Allokutzneria albata TaxID=211114 RepID=A0A1G9R2U3_ALLAB|nr:hypothetical protein [Allokutzneria albata]SDM17177.1 hypothetical protein SAMN04489726_0153 [Allokutzneria albata]